MGFIAKSSREGVTRATKALKASVKGVTTRNSSNLHRALWPRLPNSVRSLLVAMPFVPSSVLAPIGSGQINLGMIPL